MTTEIKLLNLSGTIGDFIGSHAAAISLLVGVSGATFVPIRVLNDGTLLTSGA